MSSIKNLAIRGATWSTGGFGASQVLRLGSNLVLTRLLFPEVFGLSALITVFMTALQMFSDVGIGPSIVQNDRGDDPDFLNTAWTIQVIRGIAIWGCACAGAWPFAVFYGEGQLKILIIVSGFSAVISGLNSTSLFSANRKLQIKSLTFIEIGSQLGAISITIIWAVLSPTIWAVVAGGLVGSLFKMIASHIWLANIRNKFAWDRQSLDALVRFGRWIFVSTILGFLVNNIDRLVLGKILTLSELGVYSIAVMFAKLIEQVFFKLNSQILFPVYARLKHLSIAELLPRIRKIRLSVMGILLPPLWIQIIFGQDIIKLLYDQRYYEAGWMLQVLSVGPIVLIGTSIGPIYLAAGNSFLVMLMIGVKALLFLFAMAIGGYLYGTVGLIVGISFSYFLYYPVQAVLYSKYSLWQPKLDIFALFGSFVVVVFGLWLRGQF